VVDAIGKCPKRLVSEFSLLFWGNWTLHKKKRPADRKKVAAYPGF
jgi:hypothetical protein